MSVEPLRQAAQGWVPTTWRRVPLPIGVVGLGIEIVRVNECRKHHPRKESHTEARGFPVTRRDFGPHRLADLDLVLPQGIQSGHFLCEPVFK